MTDSTPLTDDLSAVLARMSAVLVSRETVTSALQLVAQLAVETIPGSAGAGVTLVDPHGRRTTAAASDARVEHADRLQYELDEGPCLAAWATGSVVRVTELATDTRWPRWAEAAVGLGLGSALSVPLATDTASLGAMKVYASQPRAFDGRSEQLLTLFAPPAAVLVANVQAHEDARRTGDDLKAALRSRDLIGQAKGVLMSSRGVDEDGAFLLLAAAARRDDRSTADVAREIVEAALRRRR